MSDDRVKLGCAGWVAAVLTFSWVFTLVLSEDAAIIAGVVAASLLAVGLQFAWGWRQGIREHNAKRPPP